MDLFGRHTNGLALMTCITENIQFIRHLWYAALDSYKKALLRLEYFWILISKYVFESQK